MATAEGLTVPRALTRAFEIEFLQDRARGINHTLETLQMIQSRADWRDQVWRLDFAQQDLQRLYRVNPLSEACQSASSLYRFWEFNKPIGALTPELALKINQAGGAAIHGEVRIEDLQLECRRRVSRLEEVGRFISSFKSLSPPVGSRIHQVFDRLANSKRFDSIQTIRQAPFRSLLEIDKPDRYEAAFIITMFGLPDNFFDTFTRAFTPTPILHFPSLRSHVEKISQL